MTLFLQNNQHNILGNFSVAQLIIDSVLIKYKLKVKAFFEKKEELSQEFHSIIDQLTIYQMHQHIGENCASPSAYGATLASLIQDFSFDYLGMGMRNQNV